MKYIKVTEEFYKHALELAQYVDAEEDTLVGLTDFKNDNGELEKHILWSAAVVGGWEDNLQDTWRNL